MCDVSSIPTPRIPTKDDIFGEDPWSNRIINPAFAQDPTGIMRQSDVVAIDSINTALGTDVAVPASEMLGGLMNPDRSNVVAGGGGGASSEFRDAAGNRMTTEEYAAAQTAKAAEKAEEKRRVAAWRGEDRSRRGRASTLLTGPRGLSSDGTTARRTLLAM